VHWQSKPRRGNFYTSRRDEIFLSERLFRAFLAGNRAALAALPTALCRYRKQINSDTSHVSHVAAVIAVDTALMYAGKFEAKIYIQPPPARHASTKTSK
jgi:hypothetical protein